jgi:hypothetical protein
MRDEERHMHSRDAGIDVNWGGTFEGFRDHNTTSDIVQEGRSEMIRKIRQEISKKTEELSLLKSRLKRLEGSE